MNVLYVFFFFANFKLNIHRVSLIVLGSVFDENESRASGFVGMFYKCEPNVLVLKLAFADFT
jgi:hypothetical protein